MHRILALRADARHLLAVRLLIHAVIFVLSARMIPLVAWGDVPFVFGHAVRSVEHVGFGEGQHDLYRTEVESKSPGN